MQKSISGPCCSKKLLINQKNRRARYEWAKEHLGWSNSKWSHVLFSDESKICCTRPTVQGGGGGLMVWVCMTAKGPGPIICVDGHVNPKKYIGILTNVVEPFMDDNMPILSKFQHGNMSCHKEKTVCAKIEEMELEVLPWPAKSPDLNPIKNAWKVLKNHVSNEKYK